MTESGWNVTLSIVDGHVRITAIRVTQVVNYTSRNRFHLAHARAHKELSVYLLPASLFWLPSSLAYRGRGIRCTF